MRRIQYGKNLREGAKKQEQLNVRDLALQPDRPDVKKAWQITLGNVKKIFDFCKERDIPVVLVVFPFVFQFAEDMDSLSAPQKTLCEFARSHQVPAIDLLPLLAKSMKEENKTPGDYFLDQDHLSRLGAQRVAIMISDFIQQNKLIRADRRGLRSRIGP